MRERLWSTVVCAACGRDQTVLTSGPFFPHTLDGTRWCPGSNEHPASVERRVELGDLSGYRPVSPERT